MSYQCRKCKVEKDESEFTVNRRNPSGLHRWCKACARPAANAYMRRTAEARYAHRSEVYWADPVTARAKRNRYLAAPEARAKKRAYDKAYRAEKSAQIAATKKRCFERTKDLPINKIKRNMRRRLVHALRGNLKADRTFNLVGCPPEVLKAHLEKQFKPGMTWDNYGVHGWHVDHIVRCTEFDLREPAEQRACFHYSNLRPLWAAENTSKRLNLPRVRP